ncbi:MAG: hypothetical protein HY611_10055 [Elusimicrobia bacterium]|nr:hypothetical protein [Elusimicrobiota bacterium]
MEPLAVSILHAAAPRLPVSALKPVWVTGQDIARLGRAPGPAYKAILDAAACLQWAGKLSSRRQALLWLRKYKKI